MAARPFISSFLICILLLTSVFTHGPDARAADLAVVVDNGQGNGAITGDVLNADPDRAKIAVNNPHKFWTNIKLYNPLGVELTPANPLNGGDDVGGLYALLGAIGPEGQAVWDGTFDTTGSASQLIFTSPSMHTGSPIAGVFNLLTILAHMVGASPNVSSVENVIKAAKIVEKSPDFMAAVEDLGDPPPLSLALHVFNLLEDDAQVAVLQEALAELGVLVSKDVLQRLLTIKKLYDLTSMSVDMGTSIIQETSAGNVRFYQPTRNATKARPETSMSYKNISFAYDPQLAEHVEAETISAGNQTDLPGLAQPEHVRFTFDGYPVSGESQFLGPTLYVYPVRDYEKLFASIEDSLRALRETLASKPDTTKMKEPCNAYRSGPGCPQPTGGDATLFPMMPFMNAGRLFDAHMEYVDFQNGSGLQTVTELGQQRMPIDVNRLLYLFQGLTNDGDYYVVAIFPITFNGLIVPYSPDLEGEDQYNQKLVNKLVHADSSRFLPNLEVLQSLIESISVGDVPLQGHAEEVTDEMPMSSATLSTSPAEALTASQKEIDRVRSQLPYFQDHTLSNGKTVKINLHRLDPADAVMAIEVYGIDYQVPPNHPECAIERDLFREAAGIALSWLREHEVDTGRIFVSWYSRAPIAQRAEQWLGIIPSDKPPGPCVA